MVFISQLAVFMRPCSFASPDLSGFALVISTLLYKSTFIDKVDICSFFTLSNSLPRNYSRQFLGSLIRLQPDIDPRVPPTVLSGSLRDYATIVDVKSQVFHNIKERFVQVSCIWLSVQREIPPTILLWCRRSMWKNPDYKNAQGPIHWYFRDIWCHHGSQLGSGCFDPGRLINTWMSLYDCDFGFLLRGYRGNARSEEFDCVVCHFIDLPDGES